MRKALPAFCIAAGLCLLVYPWMSERLYENRADSVIQTYELQVENTDDEEMQRMLEIADVYNEWIAGSQAVLTDPFTRAEESGSRPDYGGTLSLDSTGYMGSIEIPAISVNLPVYHGTDGNVLERGAGHLEGSSFPVGGSSTHAVLSGHTGLNSAKMFTDLVELEKGDLFFIHILDKTLAYEVIEICVVEPSETGSLAVRPGRDLVTLVTCTPYGINSHRLLVTGERVAYTEERYESERNTGEDSDRESLWMRTYKRALCTGVGTAASAAAVILLGHRLRKGKARGPARGRGWQA